MASCRDARIYGRLVGSLTQFGFVQTLHFFNLLPGGYSSLEPRLPIPNRTVKRVCADDSVPFAHAKVGYRQTIFSNEKPGLERAPGFFVARLRRRMPRGGGAHEGNTGRRSWLRRSRQRRARAGNLSIEAGPHHGVFRGAVPARSNPPRPNRAVDPHPRV